MKHYILDTLTNLKQTNPISYHMPGHKNGKYLPPIFTQTFGTNLASYDITEIYGVDNLHDPQSCILQSQQQSAQIYNAKDCHYLINGTTSGIQASILANCYKQQVFVPRHCHISVLHSLILAQAIIIYLPITLDSKTHLPLGVSQKDLQTAISNNPTCKNLIMVNPTYQGITWQNQQCLQTALKHNLTVIVDEAHGAHLHFSPNLPPSLLDKGAHIVIQSWHKMLPTLTQTSAVLTNHTYNGPSLLPYLAINETSSPSYPLMCALEACAIEMYQNGKSNIENSLSIIKQLETKIATLENIHLLKNAQWLQDSFKLNLYSTKVDGNTLATLLRTKFSLYVEMSDINTCLLLLPLKFSQQESDTLFNILTMLNAELSTLSARTFTPAFYTSTIPKCAINLATAFFMPTIKVNLKDSLNKISGQFIKLYPPGIPLVMIGEIITQDVIDLYIQNGGNLNDKIAIIQNP